MPYRKARILVLCKTYPSPSSRYAETSCIAGLEEDGQLIRLYPVPFRLIGEDAKFKKWQWITAQVEKASRDNRPESHRIGVDTIACDESVVSSRNGWALRMPWLEKIPLFSSFHELDHARVQHSVTLGLVRPARILELEITPTASDWSEEEKKKLLQLQRQGNLFDDADASSIAMLRKLPFDFHYRYACPDSEGKEVVARHKIVDWEVGALYWNVLRQHGKDWEAAFRHKMETDLPSKDLMFLMGTIHRFPDQWLIVSLIYPPKPPAGASDQLSLL